MSPVPHSVPLRLFEPTSLVLRELVRHQMLAEGYACEPKRRHEARVLLDQIRVDVVVTKRVWTPGNIGISPYDVRWPKRCEGATCSISGGYTFEPTDNSTVLGTRMMCEVLFGGERVGGDLVRSDRLPVGAMYRCEPGSAAPRPFAWDLGLGECFVVVTPDGSRYLPTTEPDKTGCLFTLGVRPSDHAIEVDQIAGPASRWAVRESRLVLDGGAAS